MGHRVGAIFADAHKLPFDSNYADIIISRGSFHFWADKKQAFKEIYRVLKPGALAYIGRGFARDMPVEAAKSVRARQKKKMNYDRTEIAENFQKIMKELGIKDYTIHQPNPPTGENINYGIWIEIHKPIR